MREALAPLPGLPPLVGNRTKYTTAECFDTGLTFLGTLLNTLRFRWEVDSESAMEHVLPVIAERMDATLKELRDAGEAGAASTLSQTLEAAIAPVKEHPARWHAAPRVHAGTGAVSPADLLPRSRPGAVCPVGKGRCGRVARRP